MPRMTIIRWLQLTYLRRCIGGRWPASACAISTLFKVYSFFNKLANLQKVGWQNRQMLWNFLFLPSIWLFMRGNTTWVQWNVFHISIEKTGVARAAFLNLPKVIKNYISFIYMLTSDYFGQSFVCLNYVIRRNESKVRYHS